MNLKIVFKICTLFFAILFFLFAVPVKASAASFWLSPSTGAVSQGQNIIIGIGVNTGGESVNAVQANLTYATDKFDFVSLGTSGSALTIIAEKSGSGGQVRIGGGAPSPGFSGSKTIATLTLKAKVSSGSTQITFNGDSKILRNSDSQNIATANPVGTFSFQQVSASTPAPSVTTITTTIPVPTAQTEVQPVIPVGEPETLVLTPTATEAPKFYDNINPLILYGVIGVSLIVIVACIAYLIITLRK